MKYYIAEIDIEEKNKKNAGGKARKDAEAILEKAGYQRLELFANLKDTNSINFIARQFENYNNWKKLFAYLKKNDIVFIQFPLKTYSVFFPHMIKKLRLMGVHIVFLVHDLDKLRFINSPHLSKKKKFRMYLEDTLALRQASYIISHNEIMSSYLLQEGVSEEQIVNLQLFDYLLPESFTVSDKTKSNRVIIAGNLSKKKTGYLYQLQDVTKCNFDLYGVGYEPGDADRNISYHGSFLPDELPYYLEGSFGLVWDGASIETCSGIHGEYTRYNNPHKTSLYLACGFPVIVWEEAAIARFIIENGIGIAVRSLKELPDRLSTVSEDEYINMCRETHAISDKLRSGWFLRASLKEIESRIDSENNIKIRGGVK